MKRTIKVGFVIGLIACLLVLQTHSVLAQDTSELTDIRKGPYVDSVQYEIITSQNDRVQDLLSGVVDIAYDFIDPVHLPALQAEPRISTYEGIRNGYGHIIINCRDYPLNISGLRRAFAFAFDKTRVTTEIMDGFSIEYDSIVPLPNSWSVEEDLDWHYYDARPDIGNQILDDLGFSINSTTGFRDAPNGDPFDIIIEYSGSSPTIAGETAQIGVDALHELHIDAEKRIAHTEYGSPLDNHGAYDMVFYAVNFYNNDVDWLAYEYWSEYADVQYQNPTNFVNASYDSWRDPLLSSVTYEEVYEAASEMQKILHYNVPLLVVYVNTYTQAYRTDLFTGHVEDLSRYISGPWTLRNIRLREGGFGGTLQVALAEEPDSFNIFATNSVYSTALFENLWPSLFSYGPDMTLIGNLATSLTTETHDDNLAVPDGNTRFTIDIVHNATWSDGTPLTADDVAFTFSYAIESGVYGNPAAAGLSDLVAASAPTSYRAVLEFSTESYWHVSNFAFDYIIPKHIFNDIDGIGFSGWNTWNPVFNGAEPHVTCGPFDMGDFDAGEFYEIVKNTDFYHQAIGPPPPEPTTNTTPSETTSPTGGPDPSPWSLLTSVAITVSLISLIVIIISVILTQRYREDNHA